MPSDQDSEALRGGGLATTPWSTLIIDDDPGVRQSLRLCLEAEDVRVLGVGTTAAALEALRVGWYDVIFLDLWLGKESGLEAIPQIRALQPGASIIVVTAFASFETAVEAMRLGAVDYLPKPFTPQQVRHAAHRLVKASTLQRRVAELEAQVHATTGEIHFGTQSALQARFMEQARRAAEAESVLLLRGESGTGKNVLARWIAQHSRRRERPFVTVHCPMLTGELMVSTLFGHRRGAFTGAVADSIGKVEEAHGGTLFLDEVGDLTPEAQARLLRFLNDRSYERLGEARERQSDVRLIAATNRHLEEDVAAGRFRADLLFRLDVITLTVPPLRERPEDILELARNYLAFQQRSQGRHGLHFAAATEQLLATHPWPGNLRELRNAIERAVILATGPMLEPADLGLGNRPGEAAAMSAPRPGADISLRDLEREHIARVMARAGSMEAAARILGIDPSTLQRKRKRYGLD